MTLNAGKGSPLNGAAVSPAAKASAAPVERGSANGKAKSSTASAERGSANGKAQAAPAKTAGKTTASPAPAKAAGKAAPGNASPDKATAGKATAKASGKGVAAAKGAKTAATGDPTPSSPPPKKPVRKSIKEAAGVSTDAVARRTGKTWDDWFEVLDNAGAATLDQRGIIAILAQKHGIGPWWQQMIAVGYESLRSKLDKPAASDGFQINSSCTLDAPLSRVFRLWNDAGERARWLADDRFVVRSTTGEKIIRARWGKGTSQVAVSFAEKAGRTEVSVDHLQIESRDAADQMKAYWAKKLGLLDQALAPRR